MIVTIIRVVSVITIFLVLLFIPISVLNAQEPGITILRIAPNGSISSNCGGGWDLLDPIPSHRPCDLQYALTTRTADVDPISGIAYELWVKAGTYIPTVGGMPSRLDTFLLRNGVDVYGGFLGIETARDQRDWTVNFSILSGDIDGAGTNPPEHAYHVVTISETDSSMVIDGFVIQDGQADGGDYFEPCRLCGGGVYVGYDSHSSTSGPVLTNLTVEYNIAHIGGGIYNKSPVHLENINISHNEATGHGGGMYAYGRSSQDRVTYSENTAYEGGGIYIYNTGLLDLHHCNITYNISLNRPGGGIFNEGGSLELSQCNIDNNISSGDGGGIYHNGLYEVGYSLLSQCNITNNTSSNGNGGGIANNLGNINIDQCNIAGNKAMNGNGGGIYSNYGKLQTISSAINANLAANGGGLFLGYVNDSLVKNSTIYNNSATRGGGIYNYYSSPEFSYLTLGLNTADYGGGLFNAYTSNPAVKGSIIWGNKRPNNDLDQVYNLSSSAIFTADYIDIQGGCPLSSSFICTHTIGDDPLLGDFGNHGGSTLTIPLPSHSPAIDRIPSNIGISGDSFICRDSIETTDQRGIHRPMFKGCDLGAYEMGERLYLPVVMQKRSYSMAQ